MDSNHRMTPYQSVEFTAFLYVHSIGSQGRIRTFIVPINSRTHYRYDTCEYDRLFQVALLDYVLATLTTTGSL